MGLRLPLGRSAFFAASLIIALTATLPMRLALDGFGFGERGLTARGASGSVWAGALHQAQVGPVALGDMRARLNLLPLFLGRARLSLHGVAETAPIEGAVTVAGDGFGVDDVDGRFRVAGPLPLAALHLDDLSAGFAHGRCVRADGRVRAVATGTLAGATLAGSARCDGEALLLPLAAQGGVGRADIRLWSDGRYRIDLRAGADGGATQIRGEL